MNRPKPTEKQIEKLAELIVDSMDLDCLVAWANEMLVERFENDTESFYESMEFYDDEMTLEDLNYN